MNEPNERERLIEDLRKWLNSTLSLGSGIGGCVQAALAEIDELRERCKLQPVDVQKLVDYEQAATIAWLRKLLQEAERYAEVRCGHITELDRTIAELQKELCSYKLGAIGTEFVAGMAAGPEQSATIAEQAAEIERLAAQRDRYRATCNQLQAELAELRRRV